MAARNANLERLHEDSSGIMTGLRSQLNQVRLNANDMAAEKRLIEEKMRSLNMELQAVRLQN